MKKTFILFNILVFMVYFANAQTFVSTNAENKNVILEEYTGIYCGYCPDGAYRVKNLINDNDGRVVAVSLHAGNPTGDAMEIAHTNYLETTYQNVPLVADVHHNGMKIALEVANHVDKVRINPGLFVFEQPDPNRKEFLCF